MTAIISTLRRDHPAYAALKYPQPLPIADLALQPQETLVAYEVTEKETFAWFIRGKKIIEALTIPVTRQALTAQINQYQQFFAGICSAADLSRFDPQAGKKLYDLLLKDFAPLLQEGERLVIVPDEIIGILPFEALVMELPAKVEIATG